MKLKSRTNSWLPAFLKYFAIIIFSSPQSPQGKRANGRLATDDPSARRIANTSARHCACQGQCQTVGPQSRATWRAQSTVTAEVGLALKFKISRKPRGPSNKRVDVREFYTPQNDWAKIKEAADGAQFSFVPRSWCVRRKQPARKVGGFSLKSGYFSPEQIKSDLISPQAQS